MIIAEDPSPYKVQISSSLNLNSTNSQRKKPEENNRLAYLKAENS